MYYNGDYGVLQLPSRGCVHAIRSYYHPIVQYREWRHRHSIHSNYRSPEAPPPPIPPEVTLPSPGSSQPATVSKSPSVQPPTQTKPNGIILEEPGGDGSSSSGNGGSRQSSSSNPACTPLEPWVTNINIPLPSQYDYWISQFPFSPAAFGSMSTTATPSVAPSKTSTNTVEPVPASCSTTFDPWSWKNWAASTCQSFVTPTPSSAALGPVVAAILGHARYGLKDNSKDIDTSQGWPSDLPLFLFNPSLRSEEPQWLWLQSFFYNLEKAGIGPGDGEYIGFCNTYAINSTYKQTNDNRQCLSFQPDKMSGDTAINVMASQSVSDGIRLCLVAETTLQRQDCIWTGYDANKPCTH